MNGKLEIMYLPFPGQGHLIPMSEMARAFSGTKEVKATIVTTPLNAAKILATIGKKIESESESESESEIEIVTMKFPCAEAGLPEGCENTESIPSPDMTLRFLKATTLMQGPFEDLIHKHPPHCLISSALLPWTSESAAKFNIPRLVFYGTGVFASCAMECVRLYKPHRNVSSETEPFLIPHLPGEIHMTRMSLPDYVKTDEETDITRTLKAIMESEVASLGVVVNSFLELEQVYADFYHKVLGKKAWYIGPLSLWNENQQDKGKRGKQGSSTSSVVVDEGNILKWLDSKNPNSVVYVCFGSRASFSETQLREIAKGLENSEQQFIWVVRRSEDKGWLQEFEKRMEGRGMIIWGWAPQVVILEHQAVGAFVTHCGWNSTLEAVSAGVPMITWPVSAEQFYNEKFVTEVLQIGVPVGATKWARVFGDSISSDKDSISSDKLENALHLIMAGSGSEAIRNRVHKLSQMARTAVHQNGSSYSQLTQLIQHIRSIAGLQN